MRETSSLRPAISLKRNQFGGTFGGPILKNRLFFFLGYQGTTQRSNPATRVAFVPTAQMLSGDFTAYAGPGYNGGPAITLKSPFANEPAWPKARPPSQGAVAAISTPITSAGADDGENNVHAQIAKRSRANIWEPWRTKARNCHRHGG